MSSSHATQENRGFKRKKPPTFQHFPVERAKKLKRSWVESQKIKSQWRAQKRKEALVASQKSQRETSGAKGHAFHEDLGEENEERKTESDACINENEGIKKGNSDAASDYGLEPSSAAERLELPNSKRGPSKRSSAHKNRETSPPSNSTNELTLRELQRMAYSRASLHTHKSDPLHRHRGTAPSRGRGNARGGERGRGRGGRDDGRSGIRGRGQPDMGLRMKAMLEKIKQSDT